MALVRLKRSFDEEPIDTLVIAYKKRKEDSQETSVFKFATTLNEKEDVFQHYPKVIDLADSKKFFKQKHVSNITDKLRKENRLCSKNNRLKLVNLLRESLERDSGDSQSFSEVTLLDVEKNITSDDKDKADEKLEDVKDTSYVYDIYYTSKTLNDFDITTTDSEISCHVLDSELILENYRDDAYAAEESQEDDDDSNDENNWRNDYPEEGQDDDSIGEEDMAFVVKYGDLTLEDSSEDDFVNCVDVNSTEAAMYGDGYASYKRRVKNDLSEDDDSDDYDAYDYNDYISCSDSEKSD